MKKNLPIIGIIVIIAVAVGIMLTQRHNAVEEIAAEIPPAATTTVQVIQVGSSTYVPAVSLENTVFKVVALNGKLAPGIGDYTVSFTNGKVEAKFCNGVGGDYSIKDYVITAPTLMSTLMFCEKPDGLMNIEQTFAKMMAQGAQATVTGDVLELRAGEDRMIFQAK